MIHAEAFADLDEILEPVLAAMPIPSETAYREARELKASTLQIGANGLRVAFVSAIRPGVSSDYNNTTYEAAVFEANAAALLQGDGLHMTVVSDEPGTRGNVRVIRDRSDSHYGFEVTLPKDSDEDARRIGVPYKKSLLLAATHTAWLVRSKS
jgi:hypothetical protein